MNIREIAEAIEGLNSFDTYLAWDNEITSIEHLENLILENPDGVIGWLLEVLTDMEARMEETLSTEEIENLISEIREITE